MRNSLGLRRILAALPSQGSQSAMGGLICLFGSCISLWSTLTPALTIPVGAMFAAFGIVARWRRCHRAALVFFLGGGMLWSAYAAQRVLEARWPAARDAERVIAEASIVSLPSCGQGGCEFDADLDIKRPEPLRLRARLRWRIAPGTVHAGERWQWLLRLGAPQAAQNPGAIDSERQLFRDGIGAWASVQRSALTRRLQPPPAAHGLWDLRAARSTLALRERVAAALGRQMYDPQARALAQALAVGATGAMSREQWRVFSVTGTTHLVAISGMHVTLFALIAIAVARRLWPLWARLVPVLCGTREPFALLGGLAAATAYAALAGLSVPTLRTLLMLAIWLGARLLGMEAQSWRVLSLAVIAVLLVDPLAPLAIGFWLSFGAMAALLSAAPIPAARRPLARGWRHRLAQARELLRAQWHVGIWLAPMTWLAFGSVSLAGFVVNLAAIPIFTALLVPLVLAAMTTMALPSPTGLPLTTLLLRGFETIHGWGWPWLTAAADHTAALWSATLTWWHVPLIVMSMLLLLLPWPGVLRAAALGLLWPLVRTQPNSPAPGALEMTVLQTGDAQAVLLRTAHHSLLYDTGETYGSRGTAAARLLLPLLQTRGVAALDAIVVSRVNSIESAGVGAIVARLPVHRVLTASAWHDGTRLIQPCVAGQSWQWDQVQFEMLSKGCVLRAQVARQVLLLPGNIDADGERQLIESDAAALRADVVLAARRGSNKASSAAFITATAARYVIVSARHASAAVLERWHSAHAQPVQTAIDGAITLWLDPATGLMWQTARGQQIDWLWRSPRDSVSFAPTLSVE